MTEPTTNTPMTRMDDAEDARTDAEYWAPVIDGMAEEGFHVHRCADCLAAVVHLDERDPYYANAAVFVCDEPLVPINVDLPADLPPSSMICERCGARRWSRNLHARKRELRAGGAR